MKKITLSLFFLLTALVCNAQAVFVNEIHYDNSGGDVGEGIEVAGPAGTDLTGWTIELYNGSNGTVYNTITLSGSIDDEGAGFGAVNFTQSGIQNGAPDGFALIDNTSAVIQFLSYEGSLTATNGTANGMTSTDIGVAETGGTAIGESLQLTGIGSIYTDFSWNAPATASPGDINPGQTFAIPSMPVIPVSAVTSGFTPIAGTVISNTFDGSGLSAFPSLTATHEATTPANSFASSTTSGTIVFDLGGLFSVDGLSFWNQNDGGPGGSGTSGIQNIILSSSTDGVTFSPIAGSPTVFAQVPGSGPEAPEAFSFTSVTSSFIRLEVIDNYGDTFAGFGEIAFSGIPLAGNPPMITCPGDITVNNDTGFCTAVVNFPDAIAIDPDGDLDTVIQTGGLPSGSNFPVGVSTVTFTATDLAGNTASCSFTITVNDTEAPVALCQDITVALDSIMGMVSIQPSDIDNGSSDICGVDSLSLDISTFDCSNIGANTVTLSVVDAAGNVDTCTATVTIEDNTAPVIQCVGEAAIGLPVFINEIHYDNSGADQDEAIEIAGPAGTDLSTYSLVLYNGNGGAEYNNVALSGTIDDEGAGFGAVNFPITGIQNGAPDGIVLAEGGTVLQFLSYEGSFTATDGIAVGMTSTDIGVSESSGTAIGESMQLQGNGSLYADFAWNSPVASSPGDINAGQTFVAVMVTPLEVDLDANGMAMINASDLIVGATDNCNFTITGGVPNSSNIMLNGSFETGDLSDWTAVDNTNPLVPWGAYNLNNGAGFFLDATPTDGDWLAGNGFDGDPGEAVLYQDVTIPAGAVSAMLTWDENVDYNLLDFCNGCQDRIYEVQVRDLSDNVLEVLQQVIATGGVLDDDNVWESLNADLVAYAGQDIRIAFWQSIPEAFTGPAKFALDNVVLSVDEVVQANTIDFTCEDLGVNLIEVSVTDDSGNVSTCMATVNVNDVTDPILICMDVTIELGPDGTAVVDPAALLGQMPGTFEVISISSDNQSGAVGNTDFTVDVTAAEDVTFDWMYNTDDGAAFDSFGYLLNGVYTELIDPAGANAQSGSAGPITLAPGDVFGFRSSSVDGLFGPSTTVVSNFMPGFTGQF
ncbi:MAG: HYR domain-containing protein, partial [Bacteroidota bacterium]